MATIHPTPSTPLPGADSPRLALWVTLGCACLLMLATFSPAERDDAVAAGSLDVTALAMLAVRGLVLAVLLLTFFQAGDRLKRAGVIRCLLPLGCFVLWAVGSTLWSPLQNVTLGQSGGLLMLFVLAAVVAILCNDENDTARIIRSLSIGLLAVCILLLAIRFYNPASGAISREAAGVMHSTNASASASLGLVVLVAARLLWGWKWTRVLIAPGTLIFAVVLILANNRTAMVLTLVMTAGLCVLCLGGLWRSLLLAAIGGLGAVYLALDPGFGLMDDGLHSVLSYVQRNQSHEQLLKLSGRAEMWTAIANSYFDSPWIGHGYFVSSKNAELYVWYETANWTAHNVFLQALVSTGLIGALLLCGGLGWPLLQTAAGSFRRLIPARLSVFVAAIACWYLGWGLNNASFLGPLQPESVLFFTVLGIVVGRLVRAEIAAANAADCSVEVNRSTGALAATF